MKKKKSIHCLLTNKPSFDIGLGHPMYCCKPWIDFWVNNPYSPISYLPDLRTYYFIFDDRAKAKVYVTNCICCNHEFPKDLLKERGEIFQKENSDREYDWIPLTEEFLTEEWWRKRGL